MKLFQSRRTASTSGLFPYGKSGLKLDAEILGDLVVRLFPYGKSGLKYGGARLTAPVIGSLPVWEEWIEISANAAAEAANAVSSRMGRVD